MEGNNIEMELDRILQYGVLRLLQIAYPQGLLPPWIIDFTRA